MENSENELIRRSQQGDLQAFNKLVECYQKEILNVAAHMLGNLPDAEDVCQNSWLAAWKSVGQFKGGHFRAWVLRIVVNACRDLFRRRKRNSEIFGSDSLLQNVSAPHSDISLNREITETIYQALLQLPNEQRMAIILRELNGLSYQEIATVMKCSIGTVRSRFNY